MKYHYEPGTVRWTRHSGEGDVHEYRAPNGWDALADCIDRHPLTGKRFKFSQWWIRETYVGRSK